MPRNPMPIVFDWIAIRYGATSKAKLPAEKISDRLQPIEKGLKTHRVGVLPGPLARRRLLARPRRSAAETVALHDYRTPSRETASVSVSPTRNTASWSTRAQGSCGRASWSSRVRWRGTPECRLRRPFFIAESPQVAAAPRPAAHSPHVSTGRVEVGERQHSASLL